MTKSQERYYKFMNIVHMIFLLAAILSLIIVVIGVVTGIAHINFGPTPKADGRIPVLQPTK